MSDAEKLAQVKSLMNITDTDLDAQLAVFLSFAKNEILAWLYSGKTPDGVTDVPAQYEPTQLMAVVAGYGLIGAENQVAHIENGVHRSFKYEDMIAYIRAHVIARAIVV
ncbi:MAG: phage head-tail connector protein [Christensenellales bacterium]